MAAKEIEGKSLERNNLPTRKESTLNNGFLCSLLFSLYNIYEVSLIITQLYTASGLHYLGSRNGHHPVVIQQWIHVQHPSQCAQALWV